MRAREVSRRTSPGSKTRHPLRKPGGGSKKDATTEARRRREEGDEGGRPLGFDAYSLTRRGRPRHPLPEDWEREEEKTRTIGHIGGDGPGVPAPLRGAIEEVGCGPEVPLRGDLRLLNSTAARWRGAKILSGGAGWRREDVESRVLVRY